jgi:hypothetical protein
MNRPVKSPALNLARAFRALAWVVITASSAPAIHAEGLKIDAAGASMSNQPIWPHWQARIGVIAAPEAPVVTSTQATRAAAILGDYYFTGSGFDARRVGGGLRATTGWLYGGGLALDAGARASASTVTATWSRSALPDEVRLRHAGYVGIGYTGLMFRQSLGFTADLGVVGTNLNTGATRLGSDVTLGDYRLAPTVRLGVSYAF